MVLRPCLKSSLRVGDYIGRDEDPYQIREEMGSGLTANVYDCLRINTNVGYALKVGKIKLLGPEREKRLQKVRREVDVLSRLEHPKLVRLFEYLEYNNQSCLVMELIYGGELFDYILEKRFSELEARYVFRQLLEGVDYMHSQNVIHRDLKPENVLVESSGLAPSPMEGELLDVKITDFGVSRVVDESEARTVEGTEMYMAPEVRRGGGYGFLADVWSLGVTLFVMLCQTYPFELDAFGSLGPLNESGAEMLTDIGKDFVLSLLVEDPKQRCPLSVCIEDPWVKD